jgi:adenylosuccinate synthase
MHRLRDRRQDHRPWFPPTSADSSAIKPIYTTLKGWHESTTEGITEYDKLPKLAQEYLHVHREGDRRAKSV